MAFRFSQIALVASVAIFLTLVVVNNVTDYGSNFRYVEHVLSMDTTFSDNQLKWRAITNPLMQHLFYGILIFWEASAAVLCWIGAFRLSQNFKADRESFHQAKSIAVYGLVLSMLQWLLAFLVVGGEWFLMWQSATWNAQNAALRMFVVTGLILLFVSQSWEDLKK